MTSKGKKFVPGTQSYAEDSTLFSNSAPNRNKRIALLGDSIISFYHIFEQNLNKHVEPSRATLKCFKGATSSDLSQYVIPALQEGQSGQLIIHISFNDLVNRNGIENILSNLQKNFVDIVRGSCVTVLTRYSRRVSHILSILFIISHIYLEKNDFCFVDNDNIGRQYLYKGGLYRF